jgi:hypothetical protein
MEYWKTHLLNRWQFANHEEREREFVYLQAGLYITACVAV